MIALIDSDIIAYRVSFACKDESIVAARQTVNSYIADILMCGVDNCFSGCFVDDWKLYLTGKNNFRNKIATTAVYKGNRTAEKPKHLAAIREYIVSEFAAIVVDGQEADDAIAIDATIHGDNCVIVSVDKDLDQLSGWHYNFVKRHNYYVNPNDALLNFYKQILTGDSADNIIGLSGIGKVRAEKILSECKTEQELYDACVAAYDGNVDRVIENARLLWLRRYENQMWEPPWKQT
jgi:hypothetical protein